MSGHESTLRASLSVLRDRAQAEYPGDPASRDRWFWNAAGALLAGYASRPGPFPGDDPYAYPARDVTEPIPRAA